MPRIALLGPYSSRNLGDTATQQAVIAALRARLPDAEIVGIAPEPADVLASHGIPAFPIDGWGPASGALASAVGPLEPSRSPWALATNERRARAFVRGLDLLVVSGGGQFDDFWGGPWGHPWTMYRWCRLARRYRVPVAFLAVGVDRLAHRLSRWFSVHALACATHRSFRDARSLQTLRSYGFGGDALVCPDVVFGMTPPPATPAPHRFAVVNPISRKTWAHADDDRHRRYLDSMVAASAWLASQGLALRIACSQSRMDGEDAEYLRVALAARGARAEVFPTPTVDRYLAAVAHAEVVVAARFHGVVLAMISTSPVVALSPLPKVQTVLEDVGLERYCLPLADFTTDALISRLQEALARSAEIRRRLAATCARYRDQLDAVHDALARLA